MHWKCQHPPTQFGNRTVRSERTEILQQSQRAFQGLGLRLLQPPKCLHISHSRRFQREHDLSEVHPPHLRQLLRRAFAVFAFRPQAQTNSRRSSSRPTRPLIRRRSTNTRTQQRVDSSIRIKPRNFRQPTVQHDAHTIDGERCLGNIRRHDNLTTRLFFNSLILFRWRQFSM